MPSGDFNARNSRKDLNSNLIDHRWFASFDCFYQEMSIAGTFDSSCKKKDYYSMWKQRVIGIIDTGKTGTRYLDQKLHRFGHRSVPCNMCQLSRFNVTQPFQSEPIILMELATNRQTSNLFTFDPYDRHWTRFEFLWHLNGSLTSRRFRWLHPSL